MAQHDYNIANQSGAAFRADLNNALLAIVSQNSGTSAPSTTFAHQLWADTTTSTLKIRNAANSAWIELMQLDGTLTMEDGTALLPGLAFRDDLNTGLFSDAADTLGITTNGVERVEFGTSEVVFNDGGADVDFRIEGDTNANLFFVDAGNDRVGIGTSSPSEKLSINEGNIKLTSTDTFHYIALSNTSTGGRQWTLANAGASDPTGVTAGNLYLRDSTAGANRVAIDSSGRVGIGTTSPSTDAGSGAQNLVIGTAASSVAGMTINTGTGSYQGRINFGRGATNQDYGYILCDHSNGFLGFGLAGSERARITSAGHLLVGHSASQGSGTRLEVNSNTSGVANVAIIKRNSGTANQHGQNLDFYNFGPSATARADGTEIGAVRFYASQPTSGAAQQGAGIYCSADGTQSGNSVPSKLSFYTSSGTSVAERMRIGKDGHVLFNKTSVNALSSTGAEIFGDGAFFMTRSGFDVLSINRLTSDGVLVFFYQDTVTQGSISVSGTTVSYNGAHLARWSQLPNGVERTEILRGSVLSNIDEMCEWGDEDNEQLNRMQVSDVEGDKNVAGVFQAWDDDDDTYTNDFYCAMTGDFIIRIAQGVTVERGDLLMSAGDGTAKPQEDDIIRSKTIAKVTSTNVSCTYDDGSYCVPCVLMAC